MSKRGTRGERRRLVAALRAVTKLNEYLTGLGGDERDEFRRTVEAPDAVSRLASTRDRERREMLALALVIYRRATQDRPSDSLLQ